MQNQFDYFLFLASAQSISSGGGFGGGHQGGFGGGNQGGFGGGNQGGFGGGGHGKFPSLSSS